ncbi:MAG: 6,7-dimethyl-8-ribityllumazine synthase [Planctomycetes bacterium]|nr:6,7-dimethyl-8-ribityllumazine synthase [Planctomycetota bacterium]
MAKELRGSIDGRGKRIAVAVARFNEVVTEQLLSGAVSTLGSAGVADDDIEVAWVPGAFELPAAAAALWATGRFDGIVLLGAVVRGETDHYDYVCSAVSAGAMELAGQGIALGFGLLTCQTLELALARAGGTAGNKGIDAAQAALAMANLRAALPPAG